GEHEYRSLAGGVGVHGLRRCVGGHRGDVDDMPAGAALDHPAGEGATAVHHPAEVDIEHPVVLVGRGVQEAAGLADPGIVHQHVGHAVAFADVFGEPLHGLGVGDIEAVGVRG